MGYESRLYIVEKGNVLYDDDMRWGEVIAQFNMCVCPSIYKLRNGKKTDCFIFEGENRIIKDRYEERLTEEKIEVVIELLEKDIADGEDYRRLFPLLASLKSFKEQQDMGIWDKDLVVLHYGY